MFTASRVSFEPTEGDWEKALTARLNCDGQLPRGDSGTSMDSEERAEWDAWRDDHPCALAHFDAVVAEAAGKRVAVFLDYDGTLTPIVSNPDAAHMPAGAREAVRRLAELFPTAIISGRGREKVEGFVRLRELYYAGSHGMDIAGPVGADGAPSGADLAFQPAAQYQPLMDAVFRELSQGVAGISGASVEHNKFCVSAHFRNCAPADYPGVVAVVEGVVAAHPELRMTRGRKVLEVRPQVEWDKGTALAHLLSTLGLADPGAVFALYIGDDRTDEDAFQVLADRGLGGGILVSTRVKPTAARWSLRDPAEVVAFLNRLVEWGLSEGNAWHGAGSCNGWAMAADKQGAYANGLGLAAGDAAAAVAGYAKDGCRLGFPPSASSADDLQRQRPPLPPKPPQ